MYKFLLYCAYADAENPPLLGLLQSYFFSYFFFLAALFEEILKIFHKMHTHRYDVHTVSQKYQDHGNIFFDIIVVAFR